MCCFVTLCMVRGTHVRFVGESCLHRQRDLFIYLFVKNEVIRRSRLVSYVRRLEGTGLIEQRQERYISKFIVTLKKISFVATASSRTTLRTSTTTVNLQAKSPSWLQSSCVASPEMSLMHRND
jgi:hypothetical protein